MRGGGRSLPGGAERGGGDVGGLREDRRGGGSTDCTGTCPEKDWKRTWMGGAREDRRGGGSTGG